MTWSISGSRSPVGEELSRKSPHSCGQVQSENECMTVDIMFYSPTLTNDHEQGVDHRYNQGTLVILRGYLRSDLRDRFSGQELSYSVEMVEGSHWNAFWTQDGRREVWSFLLRFLPPQHGCRCENTHESTLNYSFAASSGSCFGCVSAWKHDAHIFIQMMIRLSKKRTKIWQLESSNQPSTWTTAEHIPDRQDAIV